MSQCYLRFVKVFHPTPVTAPGFFFTKSGLFELMILQSWGQRRIVTLSLALLWKTNTVKSSQIIPMIRQIGSSTNDIPATLKSGSDWVRHLGSGESTSAAYQKAIETQRYRNRHAGIGRLRATGGLFFSTTFEGIQECLANGRHNFRRQRPATTFTPSKPSNMKTFCEVCTTNPAALVCCADDAVMCGSCDER